MATIDQFRSAAPVRSSLIAGFFASIAAWMERHETARQLSRLSNRELSDLGLTRADIADIAEGKRPASRM